MTDVPQRSAFQARETVGEIVGYVGAAIGLTAAGIALGNTSSASVQVVFNLVTAVVLFGAGFAIGEEAGAYGRMRSVFWFLSVFLMAGMIITLLGPILDLSPKTAVILSGLVTAAYSFVLLLMSQRSLQAIALILSAFVTVVALVFPDLSNLVGPPSFTSVAMTAWLFGGLVIAAGAFGVLKPRKTTLAVGSVLAVLGPLFLLSSDTREFGEFLSLLTAIALLAAGAWFAENGVSGIGIAGILVAGSTIVANHVGEQTTAIVVLIIGLVMVGAAIVFARTADQAAGASTGSPPPPPAPPAD